MIRLFCFLMCLFLAAPLAEAQKAKTDPRMSTLEAVLSEKDKGFPVTGAILSNSFASHLHGPRAPRSAVELAALPVPYDPQSGTRLSTGIALYHLAEALSLLKDIDTEETEAFLRIFQIRLLMLAGQTEQALDLTRHTMVERFIHGGWSDAAMNSLLADAAVLELRAGDSAEAQKYFRRAMSCGTVRCPQDIIFRWLGPNRRHVDPVDPPRDPDTQLAAALALAGDMFRDDAILADIRQEAAFFTGGFADSLNVAVQQIQSATPLSDADRRRARLLADRLMRLSEFEAYAMGDASIAGQFRQAFAQGKDPELINPKDADYIDPSSYQRDSYLRQFPLVLTLLRHSDRPGDAIVADQIRLRLIAMTGDTARAAEGLQGLIASAIAQGFSDAQLFSPMMDLWALASVHNDTDLAEQMRARVAPCRQSLCDDDLALRFFNGTSALPRSPAPEGASKLNLLIAKDFVKTTFPGDRMRLADLYPTGPSDTHPMDAADSAELSMRYAESAKNPKPAELVARATRAMGTLIYAGRYDAAAAMGDRIAARLTDKALTGRFFQIRARAAHRIDDPRAKAFYQQAVARGGDRDLALDLLDTPFLDVLESALDAGDDDLSIRARLRHRQGRHAEAADLLALRRHQLEQTITDPAPYSSYWDLKLLAFQEAHYRAAAGDAAEAERLRNLGGTPSWFHVDWQPLPDTPRTQTRTAYGLFDNSDSYSKIRDLIEIRDRGNYEGAAEYMKTKRWVAVMADANGTYLDAQTLWQMAFTFVRGGETEIAFDLMNRAARIAATLSFEGAGGAGGGTLQLLERDRWRYLLFVDIAWASLSGQSPEDMLVVSRY